MFTVNNTRGWHDHLPTEQFDIAMDFARESKKLQKEVHYKRKMMIHATRAERLEKNMEDRKRKEMNLVLEKERLAKEIYFKKLKNRRKKMCLENSTGV